MKTGNNNATNNFVVRIWSPLHYGITAPTILKAKTVVPISGTITDVKSNDVKYFRGSGDFLTKLENMHKSAEKSRAKNMTKKS